MTVEDIVKFLRKKGWIESTTESGAVQFNSPDFLGFNPTIEINIPRIVHAVDLDRYTSKMLDTLADIYDLSVTDLTYLIKPIINCHTQIYTADHVPPFLAKSLLPFPLYFLFPFSLSTMIFRTYYAYPYRWHYQRWYRKASEIIYRIRRPIERSGLGPYIGLLIAIQIFFVLLPSTPEFEQLRKWSWEHHLIVIPQTGPGKILAIIILLLLFKSIRNMAVAVLEKLWSLLAILPEREVKELIQRYLYLGRFSYIKQETLFRLLQHQYPEGTGFVVLPMDMAYMGAGGLKHHASYHRQMDELAAIKERFRDAIYPFVFADPRRIAAEPDQFDYDVIDGALVLRDCFIRKYIEEFRFSGFKISPALGYYPFDERLLPLWKYAADNAIPIMTDCSKGVLYYRGTKRLEWDRHPVFVEQVRGDYYKPLLMQEISNREFTSNFTHPLNYLCLLEELLLRQLVSNSRDPRIREIFGYTNSKTPLKHDLNHLKLCFGHFGGDDEWIRFIRKDNDNFASELLRNPNMGMSFLSNKEGETRPGRLAQIWRYGDWYSVICSLMLQFPNIYADVSYILHNPDIRPLLKQTLLNPRLKTRVLFGTDYYMVQKYKSERTLMADLADSLTNKEFDLMARVNPREFLYNKLYGAINI
ncbi:hypothetical protein [Chryseolinea soli]|uniref:Amidohydrolase-related domain-containing protein n=1 Tax=Chryseolinea soli TaxID=2321403 RepID=A0A385SWB9_9BACT|nr:hypothetical protein [Chryseolinea soli]AYB34010.1 hypothetical protein D4L85_27040 [Chryseolinea soli]